MVTERSYIIFFLLLLKMITSSEIYIDSSYQNNDSDGSLTKPFKDSNIINQIIANGTGSSFFICNNFLITTQIFIKDSGSTILFMLLFYF